MNLCPHCGRDTTAGAANCSHCGQAVPPRSTAPSRPGDTTVRYAGPPLSTLGQVRRSTPLDTLFANKNILMIGRSADCDVCLPHAMISRHHALLERSADGRLRLTDLDSVNGIWVNGHRITMPVYLSAKAAVGIGPFLFTATDGELCTVDGSRSLRLEAKHL